MADRKKVALVTGGGSGIGQAVAVALAGEGYDVVISGRRAEALEATARMAAGIHPVTGDVGKPDAVARLFEEISARFGRIDLLFNNAGTGAPPVPMEDLPLGAWQHVVDTNLTGAFLCAQHAIRMMKAQDPKGGRIINNGSISAHTPRPHSVAYTATKHALTGLTKSIALDGRAHNIACGQIDIGNAATVMTSAMKRGALQPGGELKIEATMDVANVARSVVYMAGLPLDANVLFLTVMATEMPFVGRG